MAENNQQFSEGHQYDDVTNGMNEGTPDGQQQPEFSEMMDLNVYEDDDDETLHRKLIAAKIARKRAEEDHKLLANRIQLLRQEEQKVCNNSKNISCYLQEFDLNFNFGAELFILLCYRLGRKSKKPKSEQETSSLSDRGTRTTKLRSLRDRGRGKKRSSLDRLRTEPRRKC